MWCSGGAHCVMHSGGLEFNSQCVHIFPTFISRDFPTQRLPQMQLIQLSLSWCAISWPSHCFNYLPMPLIQCSHCCLCLGACLKIGEGISPYKKLSLVCVINSQVHDSLSEYIQTIECAMSFWSDSVGIWGGMAKYVDPHPVSQGALSPCYTHEEAFHHSDRMGKSLEDLLTSTYSSHNAWLCWPHVWTTW